MCDPHCIGFVTAILTTDRVVGRRVLEVGSLNVNGSVREAIVAGGPSAYVGVDLRPGPAVDLLCNATQLSFRASAFDIVISTEMLEHVYAWQGAVDNMKSVLKPGGVICITTRRPGFRYHGYPSDHWRFEASDLTRIFGDYDEVVAVDLPNNGVAVSAVKPGLARSAIDYSALRIFEMKPPSSGDLDGGR